MFHRNYEDLVTRMSKTFIFFAKSTEILSRHTMTHTHMNAILYMNYVNDTLSMFRLAPTFSTRFDERLAFIWNPGILPTIVR